MGLSTDARCRPWLATAIALASIGGNVAFAADEPSTLSNTELLKELQAMKKRISFLEQELRRQKTAGIPPVTAQPPAAPRDLVNPTPAATLAPPPPADSSPRLSPA